MVAVAAAAAAVLANLAGSAWATSSDWSALAGGSSVGVNDVVKALAYKDGVLYVGGSFRSAGGAADHALAKWDGTGWSTVGDATDLENAGLKSLLFVGSKLYVGGVLGRVHGIDANNIAVWDTSSSTWSALVGSTAPNYNGVNGDVNAIVSDGTNLYLGGSFSKLDLNGADARRIAKWDGTNWSTLGTGFDDAVYSLAYRAASGGNPAVLYAGGNFTTADGAAANYLAKWDGTSWTQVGGGLDGPADALAFDSNGKLYVGGRFTNAGGTAANGVVAWDGTTWTTLDDADGGQGVEGRVYSMAFDSSGTLYVGGDITGVANKGGGEVTVAKYMGQWEPGTRSWSAMGGAPSYGMNQEARVVIVGAGTVYAGGSFTTASGVTVNCVAKWAATYAVTYNANGSTSGSVPTDSTSYSGGGTVTVLGNTGALVQSGTAFSGWNTAANGSGAAYAAGATFAINADTTLYAQYQASGGGSGGGSSTPTPSLTPTPTPTPTPSPSPQPPTVDVLGPVPPGAVTGIPPGGLTRGQSVLLVDGSAAPVTVRPNAAEDPVALLVSAPTLVPPLTMRLEGRGDDTDPLGLTARQALILQSQAVQRTGDARSAKAKPVAVSSGRGFMPSATVKFYLLPDTYLGSLTTDATGEYNGSVPVPAGLAPGTHTLQVNALAPDASVRSLSLGVVVRPTTTTVAARTRTFHASVRFEPYRTQLTDEAKATLRALVGRSGTNAVTIRSVGFVQPTIATWNDDTLSLARARAVAQYLRDLGLAGRYVTRGGGPGDSQGAGSRRVETTVTVVR